MNDYCKKCRRYSTIDVYCQEISERKDIVKPECFEVK